MNTSTARQGSDSAEPQPTPNRWRRSFVPLNPQDDVARDASLRMSRSVNEDAEPDVQPETELVKTTLSENPVKSPPRGILAFRNNSASSSQHKKRPKRVTFSEFPEVIPASPPQPEAQEVEWEDGWADQESSFTFVQRPVDPPRPTFQREVPITGPFVARTVGQRTETVFDSRPQRAWGNSTNNESSIPFEKRSFWPSEDNSQRSAPMPGPILARNAPYDGRTSAWQPSRPPQPRPQQSMIRHPSDSIPTEPRSFRMERKEIEISYKPTTRLYSGWKETVPAQRQPNDLPPKVRRAFFRLEILQLTKSSFLKLKQNLPESSPSMSPPGRLLSPFSPPHVPASHSHEHTEPQSQGGERVLTQRKRSLSPSSANSATPMSLCNSSSDSEDKPLAKRRKLRRGRSSQSESKEAKESREPSFSPTLNSTPPALDSDVPIDPKTLVAGTIWESDEALMLASHRVNRMKGYGWKILSKNYVSNGWTVGCSRTEFRGVRGADCPARLAMRPVAKDDLTGSWRISLSILEHSHKPDRGEVLKDWKDNSGMIEEFRAVFNQKRNETRAAKKAANSDVELEDDSNDSSASPPPSSAPPQHSRSTRSKSSQPNINLVPTSAPLSLDDLRHTLASLHSVFVDIAEPLHQAGLNNMDALLIFIQAPLSVLVSAGIGLPYVQGLLLVKEVAKVREEISLDALE